MSYWTAEPSKLDHIAVLFDKLVVLVLDIRLTRRLRVGNTTTRLRRVVVLRVSGESRTRV